MTPENFCYWLQGFNELNGQAPTEDQWKSITEHLELVFKKVTPAAPVRRSIFDPLANGGPLPTTAPVAETTCSAKTVELTGVLNRRQAEALSRAVSQMSLQC